MPSDECESNFDAEEVGSSNFEVNEYFMNCQVAAAKNIAVSAGSSVFEHSTSVAECSKSSNAHEPVRHAHRPQHLTNKKHLDQPRLSARSHLRQPLSA
jgi:hypothetical protein